MVCTVGVCLHFSSRAGILHVPGASVAVEDLDIFNSLFLRVSFPCEAFEVLLAAFQRLCIFRFPIVLVSSYLLQLYPGRLIILFIQSRARLEPYSGSAASLL